MKRLVWLLVPVALMVLVVFATRYLVEYMDGPQHEKAVIHPEQP